MGAALNAVVSRGSRELFRSLPSKNAALLFLHID